MALGLRPQGPGLLSLTRLLTMLGLNGPSGLLALQLVALKEPTSPRAGIGIVGSSRVNLQQLLILDQEALVQAT